MDSALLATQSCGACLTDELHILTVFVWNVLRLFQAIDAHSASSLGLSTAPYLSGLALIITMFTMRNPFATIQVRSDGGTRSIERSQAVPPLRKGEQEVGRNEEGRVRASSKDRTGFSVR